MIAIPELAEEFRQQGKADIYRRRISREKALEVLDQGGRLPQTDYLRCKVRYFTDGGAIGRKEFVEEVFQSARDRFGPRRKQGAHPLRGLERSGDKTEYLHNLRQLQKEVFQQDRREWGGPREIPISRRSAAFPVGAEERPSFRFAWQGGLPCFKPAGRNHAVSRTHRMAG